MSVADRIKPSPVQSPDTTSAEMASQNPQDSANSYGQIVKSSSIIGGAQVINMAIGLIRTKMVAVLIGPAGVGLLAIYQSITTLASTIAGLGINTSGVREVARFYGVGDSENVAKTICTLRRVCWFTGLSGMLMLAALSPWISQFSFGTQDHAWAIALLGITILVGNITAGQGAIIQGTRRIGDIARISIWSAALGTIVSIGFYWMMGLDGIVPTLITLSIFSLLVSTYYASKIAIDDTIPNWSESFTQSKGLIRFGIAMVINGIMLTGVAYATRLMVMQEFGLIGVGIYSAAFSLSGLLVQFVSSAMGADFYPRLTAESHNHPRMVQLINEQTEVGLLLAFPGLLATLVFAPVIVQLLYTSEFSDAATLLQWFVIGCMGQVLSWPLGFSVLAKGQSAIFIMTESLFNLLHVVLIWAGIHSFGILGVPLAFVLTYFMYTVTILIVNRITINFSWQRRTWIQLILMLFILVFAFIATLILSKVVGLIVGGILTTATAFVCLNQLTQRLGPGHRLVKLTKIFSLRSH